MLIVINQKNTTKNGQPITYNLQIQTNKQSWKSTVSKMAPNTVAGPVHLSETLAADADTVRALFHATRMI